MIRLETPIEHLSKAWLHRVLNEASRVARFDAGSGWQLERGDDDTVGDPHRARIYPFEFFELVFFLKLDKQFPVEQFEATASQSTVPSPPSRPSYTWFEGRGCPTELGGVP